ncbi:MAG: hypothetical protein CMJ83_00815 [Planctomycetes bacterium]|nr:hypothetical protein [Planctomycetota bacterium]
MMRLLILGLWMGFSSAAAQAPKVWRTAPAFPKQFERQASSALGDHLFFLNPKGREVWSGTAPSDGGKARAPLVERGFSRLDPMTRKVEGLAPVVTVNGKTLMDSDAGAGHIVVLAIENAVGSRRARFTVARWNEANGWSTRGGRWPKAQRPLRIFARGGKIWAATATVQTLTELIVINPESAAVEVVGRLPSGSSQFNLSATADELVLFGRTYLRRLPFARPRWGPKQKVALPAATPYVSSFTTPGGFFLLATPQAESGRDARLFEVDLDTPTPRERHPALPAPLLGRRVRIVSGGGSLVWVFDTRPSKPNLAPQLYAYDSRLGRQHRDLYRIPDQRLDWAIDALGDERALEPWVADELAKKRPSVLEAYLRDHPQRERMIVRWSLISALRRSPGTSAHRLWHRDARIIVREARLLWPIEVEPLSKDGAYHWTVRARSRTGRVMHDVVIFSIQSWGSESAGIVHFRTVRERVYLFQQDPPYLRVYVAGVLEASGFDYRSHGGGHESALTRRWARSVPAGMNLTKLCVEDPGGFTMAPLPEEVRKLVPEPYRRKR